MKNVALIGLGRIGQMHGENLVSHKSFNLKYIFDVNDKLNTKFWLKSIKIIKNLMKIY